jgi:hypothetical protein
MSESLDVHAWAESDKAARATAAAAAVVDAPDLPAKRGRRRTPAQRAAYSEGFAAGIKHASDGARAEAVIGFGAVGLACGVVGFIAGAVLL